MWQCPDAAETCCRAWRPFLYSCSSISYAPACFSLLCRFPCPSLCQSRCMHCLPISVVSGHHGPKQGPPALSRCLACPWGCSARRSGKTIPATGIAKRPAERGGGVEEQELREEQDLLAFTQGTCLKPGYHDPTSLPPALITASEGHGQAPLHPRKMNPSLHPSLSPRVRWAVASWLPHCRNHPRARIPATAHYKGSHATHKASVGGWALPSSCFLVDCEREAERPGAAETGRSQKTGGRQGSEKV